jgi:hypothetical protein
MKMKTLEERFLEKTRRNDETGCLEWTGCKDKKGYGHFRYNGKVIRSHRVSWMIHRGDIPEGLFVCHTCDNPGCVEINHLWIGTDGENLKDMYDKGRRDQVGENNGCSKLMWEKVEVIRIKYADGGVTMKQLAEEFGVSKSAIYRCINNINWK